MDNPLHKIALHYVFQPRINQAVSSFKSAWINHPIRTENNWSPQRIWANGMMDIRNRTQSSVADVVNKEPAVDDLERCGFYPTSPTPLNDELSTVVVFDADELLSDLLEELRSLLDPLQESNNYKIDIFVHCLNIRSTEPVTEWANFSMLDHCV